MTIAQAIAAEFEVESAATHRFLERFEDRHADWQPHEKSMTASRLATHVVECPDWAYTILDADDFDLATMEYEPPHWKTRASLIENHGRIGAGFLQQCEGRSDEAMRAKWRLLQGDHVLMETTREAAVRNIILSHLVHHRGQLSVYYRLLGIPVPGPYGPSADDRDG